MTRRLKTPQRTESAIEGHMSTTRIQAVDIELAALRDGIDAAVALVDQHRPAVGVVDKAIAFLTDKGLDCGPLQKMSDAFHRRGPRLSAVDIELAALRDGMATAVELVLERRPPHEVIDEAVAFLRDKGLDTTALELRDPNHASTSTGGTLPTLNIKELKRTALEQAIAKHPRNFSAAIRELGCGRTTFYRHLKEHGLMSEQ